MQVKNINSGLFTFHRVPDGTFSFNTVYVCPGELPDWHKDKKIFDIDSFELDRTESLREVMIDLKLIDIIFNRKNVIIKKTCKTNEEKDKFRSRLKSLGVHCVRFGR